MINDSITKTDCLRNGEKNFHYSVRYFFIINQEAANREVLNCANMFSICQRTLIIRSAMVPIVSTSFLDPHVGFYFVGIHSPENCI